MMVVFGLYTRGDTLASPLLCYLGLQLREDTEETEQRVLERVVAGANHERLGDDVEFGASLSEPVDSPRSRMYREMHEIL